MVVLFPLEPEKYQWKYLSWPKFNVYFFSAQLLTCRYSNLDVFKIKSNLSTIIIQEINYILHICNYCAP